MALQCLAALPLTSFLSGTKNPVFRRTSLCSTELTTRPVTPSGIMRGIRQCAPQRPGLERLSSLSSAFALPRRDENSGYLLENPSEPGCLRQSEFPYAAIPAILSELGLSGLSGLPGLARARFGPEFMRIIPSDKSWF